MRVIHRDDRFDPNVPTFDRPLQLVAGSIDNLWRARFVVPPRGGTHQGLAGTYLYRYQLRHRPAGGAAAQVVTPWFVDPFARATEIGDLAAVTTPGASAPFAWTDDGWKVPELEDLVVYELHVEEFNGTFDGVVERLDYLESLGVTCLELMPVTSPKLDFDWGYGPLHYFAPCGRWGGGPGLKRLVDACHAAGVAVILDVVYQHVDDAFPYHRVYADAGAFVAGLASPMIGGVGQFGPEIDYGRPFARDFVQAANAHWLREYHVDGFRYDEVTDLYVGPTDQGYAKMAYDAYGASLALPRFTPSGKAEPGEYSRIIQCAEALGRAQEVLRNTYSSCAWQNGLLDQAAATAASGRPTDQFALQLDAGFCGFPETKTVHDGAGKPVDMPVAPFQYLESHDHTQLMALVGSGSPPLPFTTNRAAFYKLQPFAIALYTCQGVPMLWQGQELAESYVLADDGALRIHLRRDVHWEYFYDDYGQALVRLYRRLGTLRRAVPALRSRRSFYDNAHSRPPDGVLVYRREAPAAGQTAVVFLNFSDATQRVSVPFPAAGTYRELLDDPYRASPLELTVGAAGEMVDVEVPSNYGCVFVSPAP